jgi:aminoglycoside phosphotransferase (APT) family kinase protein
MFKQVCAAPLIFASTSDSAPGLADFGSPKAFLSRQINRWSQQFDATLPCAAPSSIAQMHQLRDLLIPWGEAAARISDSPVCIVHGDFGIHNIVWGRTGSGASAVHRQPTPPSHYHKL